MENSEIQSIVTALRSRLSDFGTKREIDTNGHVVITMSEVFSEDELIGFTSVAAMQAKWIKSGLSLDRYKAFVFQAALVAALGSKSLAERGREYKMSDNGIEYQSPTLSVVLMEQYKAELSVLNEMRQSCS